MITLSKAVDVNFENVKSPVLVDVCTGSGSHEA